MSFDYAIVIHSIHSMLKNSIHSIQKLMNGPSEIAPRRLNLKHYNKLNIMYACVRVCVCVCESVCVRADARVCV